METKEYKIRELKRKDRKTVSAMVAKLASKVGNAGLLDLITSSQKPSDTRADTQGDALNTSTINIGIEIIKLLLSTLEDDIAVWFSDLLGVTVEELDNMPVDIELQVIEQLRRAPEVVSFFSGAYRQYKEIMPSKIPSEEEKTEPAII